MKQETPDIGIAEPAVETTDEVDFTPMVVHLSRHRGGPTHCGLETPTPHRQYHEQNGWPPRNYSLREPLPPACPDCGAPWCPDCLVVANWRRRTRT